MLKSKRFNNGVTFTIDGSLYCESVVFKCFYWYGNHYEVTIGRQDGNYFEVSLSPRDGTLSDTRFEFLLSKVKTDLVDFKTREIVRQETETIRSIILAKAFAPGSSFENTPPGSISDPVGFDVADYK